jgi:hypothetical protein
MEELLMPDIDINWLAVIVATIVNMLIGAAWYSPLLFLKPWTAEVEKTIGKERFQLLHQAMRSKSTAIRTYGLTAIGAFLVSYVMGLIVDYRVADTLAEGVLVGVVTWVGFVVTTSLNTVLFEGRSPVVYLINNANHLVGFVVTGVILALWQ